MRHPTQRAARDCLVHSLHRTGSNKRVAEPPAVEVARVLSCAARATRGMHGECEVNQSLRLPCRMQREHWKKAAQGAGSSRALHGPYVCAVHTPHTRWAAALATQWRAAHKSGGRREKESVVACTASFLLPNYGHNKQAAAASTGQTPSRVSHQLPFGATNTEAHL